MTETEQIRNKHQDANQNGEDPQVDLKQSDAAPNDGGASEDVPKEDFDAVVAEREGYLEQLLRERADFANFRRRVDKERLEARQLASRDILFQLLPVMDDFNRAMAAVPEDQAESGWVSGTAMVGKKLAHILERAGVTPIEALGQRFDPAVHEAVSSEPGTSGTFVVEVYQDGYKLGQSLLRPAMVKTGDPPGDAEAEPEATRENDTRAE